MNQKEGAWGFKAVVDLVGVPGRCTRRFAQNVRRNAKFLLSPAETARSTARSASESKRRADVKIIVRDIYLNALFRLEGIYFYKTKGGDVGKR